MSTLKPAPAERQKKAVLTEQQRAKILLADPHIELLHPDRAFCRICQTWVALHKKSKYYATNWLTHRRTEEHTLYAEVDEESRNQLRRREVEQAQTRKLSRATPTKSAEELRADPDIGEVCEDRVFCRVCEKWVGLEKMRKYQRSKWYRHKISRRHTLLAAAQRRRSTQHRAATHSDAPPHQPAAPVDASQDLDNQNDNRSNASSPSVYFTPRMDLPVPDSLPSPIDSSTMGSYSLSVLDTSTMSDTLGGGPSSTAGAAQMSADYPITTSRYESHDRKPAITSILSFIKSELSPSPPYTREELTTTARVLHDLAERGALEVQSSFAD